MNSTKAELYKRCSEYVEQRIRNAEEAIAGLKESAGSETKSSAGDKHETGRAMMQIEQEKNAKQLSESRELKNLLVRVHPAMYSAIVNAGSLVITDKGRFYISISAGKIELNGEEYFAIAPDAPLAKLFRGKSIGESVVFRDQSYRILDVM